MPQSDPRALFERAALAAHVRRLATDPTVVALQVERVRAQVDACAWLAIGLGLAFTAVNVQAFAAAGAMPWSPAWLVAWLLDPMVSLLLIGVLRAEQVTARWRVSTGVRVTAVKWTCFGATYAMNTWAAWVAASPEGVVLHSIPPVIVLLGAEVAPELRDRLTSAALVADATAERPVAAVVEGASTDTTSAVRANEIVPEPAPPTDESESAPPAPEGDLDGRVRELAELLAAGCQVTGGQASVLHACSERTGRRLVAEARAHLIGHPELARAVASPGHEKSLPDPPAPGPSLHLVASSPPTGDHR